MPCVSRFFGIAVYLHYREHGPPHFHARYGDDEVSLDIKTLKILRGGLSPRCMGMLTEWSMLHQIELMRAWDAVAAHESPLPIEPLK